MAYPGQTMGGMADGKQKKYLSGLETDNPYQKYMSQQNTQPNQIQQSVIDGNDGEGGGGSVGMTTSKEPEPPTPPVTPDPPVISGSSGYDYGSNKPPTIDELMNMDTSEIAGIFGGGDKDWMEEYGMFVPEYDPYQENARKEEYSLNTSGMRDEATIAKEKLQNQFRGMSSNFNQTALQDRMIDSVNNQFDLSNLNKKQDIRGIQEDYYGDVMQSMQHLNEVGAFEGGGGKPKVNKGGNPSTWNDGGGYGDISVDDDGNIWYWDERNGTWSKTRVEDNDTPGGY